MNSWYSNAIAAQLAARQAAPPPQQAPVAIPAQPNPAMAQAQAQFARQQQMAQAQQQAGATPGSVAPGVMGMAPGGAPNPYAAQAIAQQQAQRGQMPPMPQRPGSFPPMGAPTGYPPRPQLSPQQMALVRGPLASAGMAPGVMPMTRPTGMPPMGAPPPGQPPAPRPVAPGSMPMMGQPGGYDLYQGMRNVRGPG